MRKIVAGLFISLDGVIEAPHEWHFPYFNDEMGETVGAQMSASDAMLLGRVTYQEFASFWPDKTEDEYGGAAHMNGTPKFVVSTTLDSVDEWQNSTLVKGDFVEEITKLKEQDGKNIGVTGSATLVRPRCCNTACWMSFTCSSIRSSSATASSSFPTVPVRYR
ncbi:MAG: dihydrofolate reductase family protein [Thermomicrobiales bacterium]